MNMEEYKYFYELYLSKTDDELRDIVNPANEYKEIAIKAASDILLYGRISYEEVLKKLGITDIPASPEKKDPPAWPKILALVCSFIAVFVIASAVWDLSHSKQTTEPDNILTGNFYDGSGDYYGAIFYFYGENTFKCGTTTSDSLLYGTYDMDGNALNLNFSSETLAAVIIEDGDIIMIGNNELHKTTDNKQLATYRNIFEENQK